MELLGTIVTTRVHSTKLKNRILIYCPDTEEHQGRDVLLVFNQDLGPACTQAADDNAIHHAMAANSGRRDILKMKPACDGLFDSNCKYQRTSQLLVRRSSCCSTSVLAVGRVSPRSYEAQPRSGGTYPCVPGIADAYEDTQERPGRYIVPIEYVRLV